MDKSFPPRKEPPEAMSPRPANKVDFSETSRLIRREIGTEANTCFLRRMPMFKADQDIPDDMREMLGRLERAERKRSN